MTLDNRTVVVTGGTGALGTEVVRTLLDAGATCWVPHPEPELPDHWDLLDHDRCNVATNLDLTNADAVARFYDRVGPLWASVHCAGGYTRGDFVDSELDGMFGINAKTAFLCCRAAVRRFQREGSSGRIVNVASRQGLMPRMGAQTVPYTMSKAAVAALTEALAAEVQGDGILVNAVAPALLDTPANREAMPDADYSTWTPCADVARVIHWLVAPDNPVASGAIVPVFGPGD